MQLEEGPKPGVDVEELEVEDKTAGGVGVQASQRAPHPPAGRSPGAPSDSRPTCWVGAARAHERAPGAKLGGALVLLAGPAAQGAPTKPSVPGQEGGAAGQVTTCDHACSPSSRAGGTERGGGCPSLKS